LLGLVVPSVDVCRVAGEERRNLLALVLLVLDVLHVLILFPMEILFSRRTDVGSVESLTLGVGAERLVPWPGGV
jgi:hypothetical protein